MNMYIILTLVLFIGLSVADDLSQDILDQIENALDGNCHSNQNNCLGEENDGVTNTITLEDVTTSGDACCYKYKSVYERTKDCNGKRPEQSHFTIASICPTGGIVSISAGSSNTGPNPVIGTDGSTCYQGIKFDHECGNECIYEVCIVWEFNQGNYYNPTCCTEPGFYLVKSGKGFSFDQVEVPSCDCPTTTTTTTTTTVDPTKSPTPAPTEWPTPNPTTKSPTPSPTEWPTKSPTPAPTRWPTKSPTPAPTELPTKSPTPAPTEWPTPGPTTADPTRKPTTDPTAIPSYNPTEDPTTKSPTPAPTEWPTKSPTPAPTRSPTEDPTQSPTEDPTRSPTEDPTRSPTEDPTKSPTEDPTRSPTEDPTRSPTEDPTKSPTEDPTKSPTEDPTRSPTEDPTRSPTEDPTKSPTEDPTRSPTEDPTRSPTEDPTNSPTEDPTRSPTEYPTRSPTEDPTGSPTQDPTTTLEPTASPTTAEPTTDEPTTSEPTSNPTKQPTTAPSPALCPELAVEGRKKFDAVILVDTDGDYIAANGNTNQCNRQQGFVADALTIIKSEEIVPDGPPGEVPDSRVGVVEFNRNGINVLKSLYDDEVNGGILGNDVTPNEMLQYQQLVEGRCDDGGFFPDPQEACDDSNPTDLYGALEYVRDVVFNEANDPDASNEQRDRFIIIFNNCRVPQDEVERICEEFEDYIRTGSTSPSRGDNQAGDGINVVIINGGDEAFSSGGEDYILCLAEYDSERIAVNPNRNRGQAADIITETVDKMICEEAPSPSPTSDPTADPTTAAPTTNDPTTANPTTADPTTAAPTTANPTTAAPTTSDPTTANPTTATPTTSDPTTANPTTANPTTANPTEADGDCDVTFQLDIVFVVDTSCKITKDECDNQQEMIAEIFSTIRGPDRGQDINSGAQETMKVRVAYIEMGSNSIDVLVDFADDPRDHPNTINTGKASYNGGSVLRTDTDASPDDPDTLEKVNARYVDYIIGLKSTTCDAGALNARTGSPNLDEALFKIMIGGDSLFDNADSANLNRDREILIFSNCGVTDDEREEICDKYEDEIRNPVATQNGRDNGINVNMINTAPDDDTVTDALTDADCNEYLSCLTEYDPDKRIFCNRPGEGEKFDPNVDDFAVTSICDEPTPAPTSDPTSDPTGVVYPAGNDGSFGIDNGGLEDISSQDDWKSLLTDLYNKSISSDVTLVYSVVTSVLLLIGIILCGYNCCCNKNKNKEDGYIKNKLQEEEVEDESDATDVEIDCDEEQLVE